MHVNGKCHCGQITYEAEIDPEAVVICHCTDCQTLSGTAFRTVVMAKKEGFKLLTGEPRIYIKTAESGNKRAQTFCAECGTPLWASAPTDPQMYGLRVGTLGERNELKPSRQVWAHSAQGWLSEMGSMKRLEKQS